MRKRIKEDLWELRGLMYDKVDQFEKIVREHNNNESYANLWKMVSVYKDALGYDFEKFYEQHKIWCYFNNATWFLFKISLKNELYMSCVSQINIKLWSDELWENDKLRKEVQELKLERHVNKVINGQQLSENLKDND